MIIVLGAGGMLGHRMYLSLRERFGDVMGCVRRAPELLREDLSIIEHVDAAAGWPTLRELLITRKPKVVVNCIGIIKQRPEALDSIASITTNSLLPHRLAQLSRRWDGRLIHFSSDCVFSGRKGDYLETDVADAEDLYGRTKLLGEVTGDRRALTLRTSMIGRELSEERVSLLEWFLAQQGPTAPGYMEHFFSGVTTHYLAEVVGDIIERHPMLHGLYHLAGPRISKYDLLEEIKRAFQLKVQVMPTISTRCDRSLDGALLGAIIGPTPSWRQMLEAIA